MSWCTTCGALILSSVRHTCPPHWIVWCPEQGEAPEDMAPIRAASADEAAEKWAEQEDWHSAEYRIVGGRDEPVVCVVLANDFKASLEVTPQRFQVSGEAVPSYTAREVEP